MQENVILKPCTSMYVGGPARYFVEVKSITDLVEALKFAKEKNVPYFILGGGSNILVSDSGFNGLVIKICILGRTLINETDNYIDLEVSAGEKWDDFVKFTVDNNWYGLENMSHVPGSVGASVVQNVGCYGQEVGESVLCVKAVDTASLKNVILNNKDLNFSYRKSALNDSEMYKSKYVVVSIVFRLKKNGELNLSYGDLQKYFSEHNKLIPNLQTVRQAIINVRNSKFPFPDVPTNGTCGSFWNTPVVDEDTFGQIVQSLKEKGSEKKAEEMRSKKNVFMVKQGFKITPGLLVEILDMRGKKQGGAKILENHGGIINNYTGKATAQDILELSNEVVNAVEKTFGIKIKIEPELVGDFD